VKLQHKGRRETFSLGTPNRAAAAAKAKIIYLSLQSAGWEETLRLFKPKSQWSSGAVTTVGQFLAEVEANWSGNKKTVADYGRAFRKIVADIFEIEAGSAKYDYRSGGRDAWVERINRVRLRDVSPDKIQKWKVKFLNRAGSNPRKKKSASISVNSFLRQAKSLFAPEILRFVKLDIVGSPFDGVSFEPRRSMRYQSEFNVEELIRAAQNGLPPEQFKIFLLAVMAGLRRNEIDKLEWAAFDWRRNLISIKATSYFSPKSEDSTGDVEVDPELIELFQGYHAQATSEFVVESPVAPRQQGGYNHYRCQRHFNGLAEWLREHGVIGSRPLHTLRKEYGSQVCAKHGIWAASRALRHADIAITSQHYLDKRQSSLLGFGKLLLPTAEISSSGKLADQPRPAQLSKRF